LVPKTLSVQNGLTGGSELDKETAAPVNLLSTFKQVSEDLSSAADRVIHAAEALAPFSPTSDPTKYLGTVEGSFCPLNGSWKNIFTTAADAVVKDSTEDGVPTGAQVCNIVDAEKGIITNMIDFNNPEMPLQQLRVLIRAKAVSATRVHLQFRKVKAILDSKIPVFGRLQLNVPVPGPYILKALFAARNKQFPNIFFDVLYLDADLRIQRSAQGSIYVQQRAAFSPGKPAMLLVAAPAP
jgi:hypothetical protein